MIHEAFTFLWATLFSSLPPNVSFVVERKTLMRHTFWIHPQAFLIARSVWTNFNFPFDLMLIKVDPKILRQGRDNVCILVSLFIKKKCRQCNWQCKVASTIWVCKRNSYVFIQITWKPLSSNLSVLRMSGLSQICTGVLKRKQQESAFEFETGVVLSFLEKKNRSVKLNFKKKIILREVLYTNC